MSMFGTLAKALVPAAFTLAASAAFADGPIPGTVQITHLTAAGTGCPDPSTYSTNISPDAQAFTVTFSEFVAEVGPGLPLTASRKNCSLTVDLKVPAGWQYSVATFNYRGFMDLGDRVQAEHTTDYFFQGQSTPGKFKAVVTGPVSKDFVYTDKIGLTSVYMPSVWSPCNVQRALTINPSVRVTKLQGASRDAQGIITNDSVDGELKQVFGLAWRHC
ncbi:MAG: DUF4360 domain-containing protein [Chitinophagaceae bacterium]|nr:DUF4360 domain-containing protein [Oligoflexus sp.]